MPAVVVPVPSLDLERSRTGGGGSPGPVLQQWHDNEGRLIATGGRDGGTWWMDWPGLATFWFEETGTVRVETVRPGSDAEVQDVFTRGVVPVVLLARGFEALHASAVLGEDGVIGLCGTSGTGKSTLAFALGSAGLPHYADDTIVYRIDEGTPIAVRLPFPVRVDTSARNAAGARILPFARVETVTSAPVRLIYHLRRDSTLDPRAPRFVAVPPAKRFEVLLAHAHPFDMGPDERRGAFMRDLLALAAAAVVWECSFAPSLVDLPYLAAAIRRHASVQ
jgi:hypothetical protein